MVHAYISVRANNTVSFRFNLQQPNLKNMPDKECQEVKRNLGTMVDIGGGKLALVVVLVFKDIFLMLKSE